MVWVTRLTVVAHVCSPYGSDEVNYEGKHQCSSMEPSLEGDSSCARM